MPLEENLMDEVVSVLTIEDDSDLRNCFVTFFSDLGYQVHQAANGREGLEIFNEKKPDLVFTDLTMPEMDGIQVVSFLKESSPETPVVVISGNGSIHTAIEAVRSGAWDYITKPIFDFNQLDRVIQEVLERSREMRRTRLQHDKLIQAVAEQKAKLLQLKHFDPLTGLPLRNHMREDFLDVISGPSFSGNLVIILFDLDNFKIINETLGHDCGDRLLSELAGRLSCLVSAQFRIARLGADRFAIMLNDVSEILKSVQQVNEWLNSPFFLLGNEIVVTASMGLSVFPQDGESFDRLLQNADSALSLAKSSGKNSYRFFTREIATRAQHRMDMETALRRAAERREFFLYYQPQIDAESGRISGMEALLRWQRPGRLPLVSPAEFIPVLEETGLIIEVGEWILREACMQYQVWRQCGLSSVRLSVNVSAVQFNSGNLPQMVAKILAETGTDPACLCLELTESVVIQDIETGMQTLRELGKMGIQLSIDDFGTGYSSLSYLSRMPINELKIDRLFVRNLPDERNSRAIVESVLGMAKGLELQVVAEGVETPEQASFLAARGCNELQGYLFSRPLTPGDFFTFATAMHGDIYKKISFTRNYSCAEQQQKMAPVGRNRVQQPVDHVFTDTIR